MREKKGSKRRCRMYKGGISAKEQKIFLKKKKKNIMTRIYVVFF